MNQNHSFDSFQPQPIPDPSPNEGMPRSAKQMRAEAQRLLKGNWVMGSVVNFVCQLITGFSVILGMIPMYVFGFFIVISPEELEAAVSPGMILLLFVIAFLLCFLGLLLIAAPLTVGCHRVHLEILDGKAPAVSDLFVPFKKSYKKSVGAYAMYLLLSFLALLPTMVCGILGVTLGGDPSDVVATVVPAVDVGAFLALGGYLVTLVLAVVISLRYALVFFILAEEPDMRVLDAFRNSRMAMKGNKWRLFCLQISFAGWFLLLMLAHVITCGMGSMIGSYPLTLYFTTSTAVFYAQVTHRVPRGDEPLTQTENDYLPPMEENQ
ncbi:MAG: DUF975 family protein [Clostridia bacterium]|nr:DUF975 family protein [Clostridia bacterium]